VLLHGHVGAGGGFQAGIVITGAFVLAAFGGRFNEIRSKLSPKRLFAVAAAGSGGFAAVGTLSILAGGRFLEYGALPLPFSGQEVHLIAITAVEIWIGIAVFGMMYLIFTAIAGEDA
jgi:multicomponent Na+:H+ antiporter subunit B